MSYYAITQAHAIDSWLYDNAIISLLYTGYTVYISYRKGVQHCSTESMEDADNAAIGGDEDLISVVTERQTGPLTYTIEPALKGCEWTLFYSKKTDC